jgi:hypothetical protein
MIAILLQTSSQGLALIPQAGVAIDDKTAKKSYSCKMTEDANKNKSHKLNKASGNRSCLFRFSPIE